MWQPPKYGLVQEKYLPDGWKVLCCCLCLNLTTRKQMEPVMEVLFQKWPTSSNLASANPADVEDVIKSLGMQKKRASTLISMSSQYSSGAWKDVRELKGVGEYAARAYEIFILGKLGSSPPKDHALLLYWNFLNNNHPELFVSGEAA